VISIEKVPRVYDTEPRYIYQFRLECFYILFINLSRQAGSCEFQAGKKKNPKMSQEQSVDEKSISREEILEVLKKYRAPELLTNGGLNHTFWDTQPVPKFTEPDVEIKSGPIDPPKTVSDVKKEPYSLPAAYEWVTCNVLDDEELQAIYTLLNENYVEDDDSLFRFDYSADFLRWALTAPGYKKDWHIGIRAVQSKKLVAFITGIPQTIVVEGVAMEMAEVNFLCVHKKLRSKRLAPVLIKEITRRVNLCNIWQAAYTAGVFIPRPISTCRYYHRSINPKKLIEIGFSRLAPRMTLARTMKLYKVPDEPSIPGFRPMKEADVDQVFTLLSSKLAAYKVSPQFTREEISHWMIPRKNVVYSYVVENPETKNITDFASFYSLPSSVLGHEKHKTLFAAYQFWTCAKSVSLSALTTDVFAMAKDEGFDVFNALDLMENMDIFEPLKFGIGDGLLQYYLYNWSMTPFKPNELGLILL